jgi:hypothetical protein
MRLTGFSVPVITSHRGVLSLTLKSKNFSGVCNCDALSLGFKTGIGSGNFIVPIGTPSK